MWEIVYFYPYSFLPSVQVAVSIHRLYIYIYNPCDIFSAQYLSLRLRRHTSRRIGIIRRFLSAFFHLVLLSVTPPTSPPLPIHLPTNCCPAGIFPRIQIYLCRSIDMCYSSSYFSRFYDDFTPYYD